MEDLNEKFTFWCPLQKSEDAIDPTTGEVVMKLGGIASTSDEDSDGEFLDPKGFDIKPLLNNGVVNWHHQAKEHPDTIIGEPTKAEIRPEGLYIETTLYPSSKVANDVWQLANILEKDSKTRRLGYSIEGKVLKRKSNDKSNPDYNHIDKAVITGVAITHMPKNPKTFASIIKGEIDTINERDEEQEPLSKSEVIDDIFKRLPNISIEKAKQVFTLIKNIAMKNNKKNITGEDLEKAYQALGLEKGCDDKEIEKDEDETEETAKREPDAPNNGEDEGDYRSVDKEDDEEEDDDDKKEKNDKAEKKVEKAERGNRFDRIEKAIASMQATNTNYIKALGVMIKDASNKLDAAAERESELRDLIKAQEDTISSLSAQIEEIGAMPMAPKSISSARAVERAFSKSNNDEFNDERPAPKNQLSMRTNKAQIAEILDQATFAKGYDEDFSKACLAFEASGVLPTNIIKRIQSEYGIEIVK